MTHTQADHDLGNLRSLAREIGDLEGQRTRKIAERNRLLASAAKREKPPTRVELAEAAGVAASYVSRVVKHDGLPPTGHEIGAAA